MKSDPLGLSDRSPHLRQRLRRRPMRHERSMGRREQQVRQADP